MAEPVARRRQELKLGAPLRSCTRDLRRLGDSDQRLRRSGVTYDCRANSRSTQEGTDDDLTVEVFADDAQRLLEAYGSGPALVLGSSGGPTYGLDLVARHQGAVRALIAHEPPVSSLLPDADHWRAFNLRIGETARSARTFAALQAFGEGIGAGGGPPPDAATSLEAQEAQARMMGNFDRFARRLIPSSATTSPSRRPPHERHESQEQMPARSARALAERLGVEPLLFPGDDGCFGRQPEAFAATLQRVLSETDERPAPFRLRPWMR